MPLLLNRVLLAVLIALAIPTAAEAQLAWVQRDKRWPIRGTWNWSLKSEGPALFREFNGIDFGHAHLAETLLATDDAAAVERARTEVLEFIFSSPRVSPDEEQVAPTFTRLLWDVQKTFNWAHELHRSLYDLFAADAIADKDPAYRQILAQYLRMPEAITPLPLDLHGALWSFPESKSFKHRFPRFNSQIWAYHWLQAAVYDAQLGQSSRERQAGYARLIAHYHGLLRHPPTHWAFMPMFDQTAPQFARRYPEAAHIFDNLHMLHDNLDDVLSRPDLYPDRRAKRGAIMTILPIYLHRNHGANDRYGRYRLAAGMGHAHGHTPPADPAASPEPRRAAPDPDHSRHLQH